MSEGDVSLIRDEDVLRRMWQQTEDFGRKKEIRAHMYKLREERLRDLYSPEPLGKGGDHMASFADQSFQRIKGKEVRDAASPTKDYADRQQDLKELSNAGWNVQSENRTTDDGHTHIDALQADIQGHYDVEGGKGRFAAVDEQRRARTEYKDDHKHVKKQENVSKSRAHEEVNSKTEDGTQMSSTTSSSSTQFHQVSSVEEFVPFETVNQRSESLNTEQYDHHSKQNDQQTQKTEYKEGELISRKVDYPDENTKVIVETRCLPDGTRVISTKKEFRGSDVSRSERQSKSKSESKSFTSQQRSDMQTSFKIKEQNYENHRDIVDSQRSVDDNDFNRNQQNKRQINEHNIKNTDYDVQSEQSYDVSEQSNVENNFTKISNKTTQKYTTESLNASNNDLIRNQNVIEHHVKPCENVDRTDRRGSNISQQTRTTQNITEETFVRDENRQKFSNDRVEKTTTDQYETTYQNDYTQKKISNDWSASHQAWASTLRADTPSTTRPSTRASSPGSRTFKSSTSSLRSSVSPDKTYRAPTSRGSSPNKQDRSSPSQWDKYSHTYSTQSISENHRSQTKAHESTSPERKPPSGRYQTNLELTRNHERTSVSPEKRSEAKPRRAVSPEKRTQTHHQRSSVSPDKRPETYRQQPSESPEKNKPNNKQYDARDFSPKRKSNRSSISPEKNTKRSSEHSPSKPPQQFDNSTIRSSENHADTFKSDLSDLRRASVSPDRKPGQMRPNASQAANNTTSNSYVTKSSSVTEDNFKSTEETHKFHTQTVKDETKFNTFTRSSKSPSPTRKSPVKDNAPIRRSETPTKPTLRQGSRSPSPPKGPVTFTSDTYKTNKTHTVNSTIINAADKMELDKRSELPLKEKSPDKNLPSKHDIIPPSESSYTKNDKTFNTQKNESNTVTTKNIKNENSTEWHNKTHPRSKNSPSKDAKYNVTTDFISIERQTEEFNKTTTTKDRPRQLLTPSTSPSRKPKLEREPSTGQSSPTSSVSGFEYFSGHVPVTDLDEQETYYESILSEHTNTTNSGDFKKSGSVTIASPTPSKIPCRSPSPEKRASPIKETLPRKSSLKKPSVDLTTLSSIEKPPANLKNSQTTDNKDTLDHKIVKKDRPDQPEIESTVKPKPPFERRETYEERCRKILGMMDDKNATSTDHTSTITTSNTNVSSPTLSTCLSPTLRGESQNDSGKSASIKYSSDVTDFISHENEDNNKTTQMTKKADQSLKVKSPSRESSPTKLKDIFTDKTLESSIHEKITSLNSKSDFKNETSSLETTTTSGNTRKSLSPQRTSRSGSPKKDSYISKSNVSSVEIDEIRIRDSNKNTITEKQHTSNRSSASPTRIISNDKISVPTSKKQPEEKSSRTPSPTKKSPEKLRTTSLVKARTPSPTKKVTTETEVTKSVHDIDNSSVSSEVRKKSMIMTEKKDEVIEKKINTLSPYKSDRKSPSREKSPTKNKISLQDLDEFEVSSSSVQIDDVQKSTNTITSFKSEQNSNNKPTSRNVSPVKRISPVGPPKAEKKNENSIKSRSISPKKAVSSPIERPQSPQVPKVSGIKPREPISKKTVARNISPSKIDKPISTDKKSQLNKQNSFTTSSVTKSSTTKTTTTTNKFDQDSKRSIATVINKGINKENVSPKREPERVTRTTSDTSMRLKKPSPQRVKSKPEIQVNDTPKTSPVLIKTQRPKESQSKLAPKPKSATALNTSPDDDDDVIIDVELAKSSRENSPDRICPTPVGFMDDVGTPRLPDEVSEPDDDFRKRTHHVIHETESIVDDIVEISEEEELFVKRPEKVSESDEYLLSVTDKVSKFTDKITLAGKPKDVTRNFKDTEVREHSDYIDEDLKSDECLLSVSQKVNKFAKGQSENRDTNNSSRKIVDEYDINTVYQDDYTKLSVNDKAHLFIETAENSKSTKIKPVQKAQRPDLTDVDESLKSDDCLLSVSDKVNKFVRTAEQFLTDARVDEEKEKKIREQHDFIMKKILNNEKDVTLKETEQNEGSTKINDINKPTADNEDSYCLSKDDSSLLTRSKQHSRANLKPTDRPAPVKITTLRSSEAVKKAKALFENIASTKQTSKENITTKLTDIGVIRKSSSKESANCQESNLEINSKAESEVDGKADFKTPTRQEKKPSSTPTWLTTPLSDNTRQKSPQRQTNETPRSDRRSVSPRPPIESTKDKENVPGYQRATKTSQLKEETKVSEDYEVSTRRGSGKFGVELRRASADKSTIERGASSERPIGERRRSSDHHQPCIEDIYDVALLEQMLEKVVGYEQRRRIRAQIRIAKKKTEENENTNMYTKTTRTLTSSKTANVDRQRTKSPDHQRASYSQRVPSTEQHIPKMTATKTASPDRALLKDQGLLLNGHSKHVNGKIPRTPSPDKQSKTKTRSPVRQPSPDKRIKPQSSTKTASPSKPKSNRFNEYAAAYIKKVGLNEKEAIKSEVKNTKFIQDSKMTAETQNVETVLVKEHKAVETKLSSSTITRSITENKTSKDKIETFQLNGKRSPSPEKTKSPERRASSPQKSKPRSPSPIKREKLETIVKKESSIKAEVENKIQTKPIQENKPSWVTNRNLKKITSDTRTFSTKKVEPEKPKYRAQSPSKAIVKPIDVITSSYGPGPLDADGKPLFGIKALRNGSSNYQVKGTVIRQEYHSHNGSAPEGSISVTAYSSQPEPLEQLLEKQGQPRFLQGLAAITTTKKFGGSTGTSITEAYTKEDRAALDQFTRSDLRHTESKVTTSSRREDFSERLSNQGVTITEVTDKETRKTDKQLNANKRSSVERTEERTGSTTTRKQERRVESTEKRGERMVRGDDKKTVRQSSVKSLTEKYIKSTSETPKSDRSAYPKAGLILRAGAGRRDSPAGLARAGSEHSLASNEDGSQHCTISDAKQEHSRTVTHETKGGTVTSSSQRSERSFLDSSTKVTGVQDILTRMKNADIVIEAGDSTEDTEARALLNKFLGATVLMAGMQGYVTDAGAAAPAHRIQQESVQRSSNKVTSTRIEDIDLDQCWDERLLRTFLEQCQDYEQRRRIRARLRSLMAEQEACAQAVTAALGAAGDACDEREEAEEVTSVSSSVRRGSNENSVTTTTTTTTRSSKVIESMTRPAPKQVSPFAKFRQLEKQNSTDSSNGRIAAPLFRITDPALQASALTIKERLLQWCRDKTRDYENVKLENFSTSWADGLAFCALVHHFLPDAFDYSALSPDQRRHNFTLAFKVADEKAGIYPLLDVEDMVAMRRPDWKCVFTYVQAIHRRFRDQR